jgi:hypothetical protein
MCTTLTSPTAVIATAGRYGGVYYAMHHYFISCEGLSMQFVDCGLEYKHDELLNREGMKKEKHDKMPYLSLIQFRAGLLIYTRLFLGSALNIQNPDVELKNLSTFNAKVGLSKQKLGCRERGRRGSMDLERVTVACECDINRSKVYLEGVTETLYGLHGLLHI